jgi:hypothetical protein
MSRQERIARRELRAQREYDTIHTYYAPHGYVAGEDEPITVRVYTEKGNVVDGDGVSDVLGPVTRLGKVYRIDEIHRDLLNLGFQKIKEEKI